MDGLVPFVKPSLCGYKRSAIALAPNFYWTAALPSSNIELVPRTCPSPNPVSMTACYVAGALVPLTAAAILTLGARDTLGTPATVGLLFPVAVWLAVRTWRAMTTYSLTAVALDDTAVSLMLGLPLVTLLVWMPDRLDCRDIEQLADALHIPPVGVAAVREALRLAPKYADLPQWWSISLYLLLAAASVAFAIRPALLPALMRRLTRLPVMPL
jgi:hypothetical protein